MRRILSLYKSSCLRGNQTGITSINQPYYNLRKLLSQTKHIPTRHTYSTMSNASLSTSLSLPSGKKLTVPTGLFINNEFVASVTGDTLVYVRDFCSIVCVAVMTYWLRQVRSTRALRRPSVPYKLVSHVLHSWRVAQASDTFSSIRQRRGPGRSGGS